MSALALLTGRLAAGVWKGGTMPATELVAFARGLGWPIRSGEISAFDDKAAYLTQLGELAEVPDYVRPNWDSLADGLRDTDVQQRQLLVIETDAPTPFDALAVEVLDEAAAFWAAHGATMQVVWFGPIEAPALDQIDPLRRSRSRTV